MLQKVTQDISLIMEELFHQANPAPGSLFVLGCSTSEVLGAHIGTHGNLEVAESIFETMAAFLEKTGVHLAVQCCEHLNRALVIEEKTSTQYNFPPVTARPTPKAGGSMASLTWDKMENPVLVEHIQADLGLDIGGTLIGMHLKHVAVPLRLSIQKVGCAHIICATTRPKLIGGERTVYA